MPEDEFLHDEAGFDGFAEAHVVSHEQIHPWHGQGTHDGVELVIVHFDAAAERGLQGFVVGAGNGSPGHGIEEGVERAG